MNAKQQPIGVLIIGRKRPGFDQEWNGIMVRRCLGALAEMQFDCIGAETPVVDEPTIRAAITKIKSGGCESLVVLQPSLGNGQLSLTVAQEWSGPVVLWATPERQESPKASSCSLVAQHLWASVFRQEKHPFELVYGDANDAVVRADLRRAIALSNTLTRLKKSKVGLVGSHAPGFLAMQVDGFALQRQIGPQLHTLSLTQFFDRAGAIDDARAKDDAEKVRKMGFPMTGVSVDDLPTNSRIYLALNDLIAEESLDAIAVQCWPEFANVLGQWPYLAFTRLSHDGVPMAMEGDVDGALLCLLAKHLGLGEGFITDWLEHDPRSITFWHAGIAPLSLCNPIGSPNGPHLAKHFNIEKPLVVDGALRVNEPVTIARLWRCDGTYRMTAFEGKTVEEHRPLTGNTARVECPGRDVGKIFDDLLHEGMPHHPVIFFGRHTQTLRRLARMMDSGWVAIT